MNSCPSYFPVALIKYSDPKQLMGGKGLSGSDFQGTVHHWGKPGQEPWKKTAFCLLATHASAWLSYKIPGPLAWGMMPPTVGWVLQQPLAIQKVPTDMPTSQPELGNSSNEALLR